MSSVYHINMGINASLEFKGLKAQYIGYFAGLLLGLLIVFALLYVMGVPALICVVVIGAAGGFGGFKLYALSHKYGPHGMMKLLAQRRVPKVLKCYSRRIFY